LVSIKNSRTKAAVIDARREIGCRAYIIGHPSDPKWSAQTIAETFYKLQQELKTLVHGLYVLGIGYFETASPDAGSNEPVRIVAYPGDDRLFRFATSFRTSMDRWPGLEPGTTAHVGNYVTSSEKVLVTGDVGRTSG
jgi:hypothetical protein